jgi:CTP synthase (UTP-ammonia lyase)
LTGRPRPARLLARWTMKSARIALVGDFSPEVAAHACINQAVALFNASADASVEASWVSTDQLRPGDPSLLSQYDGIWCVPGSPYRNTAGALWAIQFARTHEAPFLGTCGGYQHAILEYARHALGLTHADHEEMRADAEFKLLTRLSCPMIEKSEAVFLTGQNILRGIYGQSDTEETYHCSYGLAPEFEPLFHNSALEIAARSPQGAVRAVVLRGHPFFIGVGYQPERRARQGEQHPLVGAFFRAACDHAAGLESLGVRPDYFEASGETTTMRFLCLLH